MEPAQSKFSLDMLKDIYYWKTDLLVNGLKISEDFYDSIKPFEPEFYRGRKGGAGPAGGRYFIFENGSIVNVSLYGSNSENSYLVLEKIINEDPQNKGYLYVQIYNSKTKEYFSRLRLIPVFSEYNLTMNTAGIPNSKIALIHGNSVLASTIIQKCHYWEECTRCRFCGIEFSLKDNSTIEIKTAEQLIHAIRDAQKLGLCEHITLTSGTTQPFIQSIEHYIDVVSGIRQQFPTLPIHIQTEPVEDSNLLQKLHDAGVNTIGIHLEIIDDVIRKQICPGKSITKKAQYEACWKKSVEIFGKGQVTSFILTGFNEDINQTKEYVDFMVRLGVIPVIVPVRQIQGNMIVNDWSFDKNIEIINVVAQAFIKNKIDPRNTKAGCAKCGGCSSIIDAYSYFLSFSRITRQ